MRKVVLTLLALTCMSVNAEEVYMPRNYQLKVGQVFEDKFPTIYYIKQPCGLPLVNKEHMRKYTSFRGVLDVGCWGETIDGDVFTVVPKMASSTMPKKLLMRVDTVGDGKFKVLDLPKIQVP